jgi:hypothetical protein
MATKFSQFNAGGALVPGDIIVGLRNGVNTQFIANALPDEGWITLAIGQPLVIDKGYFLVNPIPASFALPTVAAFGQIIQIVCFTNQICTITQAAHQQIQFGPNATTLGIGGSIANTQMGDSITLVCNVPNTNFVLLGGPQGIWTVT